MQLLQIPQGIKPVACIPYGCLSTGFVGASVRGRKGIWFAFARNGTGPTYMFPVLKDGNISNSDGTVFYPEQEMPVYKPADLGIDKICWTDAKMD